VRLLTYNIRGGGVGRVGALAAVVSHAAPDLAVLQEATRPDVVEALAAATGMTTWASRPKHSLGFMSRVPIAHHEWHRPAGVRRAFLEIVPEGGAPRVFGIHLSAVHSNWTERRRVRELRATLKSVARHQEGFHLLAGDFNTLAPGEELDLRRLPPRLRAVVWLTGRQIRWETIQIMLDAAYVDGYRALHPEDPGYTFPTWDPHVRLDYAFVPLAWSRRVTGCSVVGDHAALAQASDHRPLLAVVEPGS
jgi:endonuclease/exonuclease/phosphatase family metal-dependent hydrolase